MIYTGIGSRKTPIEIINKMIKLGQILGKHGYILRSGGANGADKAFEQGCDNVLGKKEIYLPWKGFNENNSNFYDIKQEAFILAQKYHPCWSRVSNAGRKLHSRNVYQVLGYDLNNPTDFIICWTPESGGTQQALRIAYDYNIKIFNLFYDDVIYHLKDFLYDKFINL